MIVKVYEISCDYCGQAYHSYYSVKAANEDYISKGGVVRGGRHFCGESCYENYKREK